MEGICVLKYNVSVTYNAKNAEVIFWMLAVSSRSKLQQNENRLLFYWNCAIQIWVFHQQQWMFLKTTNYSDNKYLLIHCKEIQIKNVINFYKIKILQTLLDFIAWQTIKLFSTETFSY